MNGVNLHHKVRYIDLKMEILCCYEKKRRTQSKLKRSWSPLHLILMSVLWLSCFQRSQLLRWSDWMTEITCVESPMRQLIDNAWQKCFCLPTDLSLSKVSVSCFSFFFWNLTRTDGIAGQEVWSQLWLHMHQKHLLECDVVHPHHILPTEASVVLEGM